ncbi:sirohydrochlorin chelatase [Alicyclobacillus sp. ALC3]|nr:sirohydrochlorin chelatase [Alicyclobacillus sp. ALC3]
MKTAVLLIGHGSRDEEGNEEFLRFVDELQSHMAGQTVVGCFLEFADPDIPAGIEVCMALGAKRIVAVPVILLAASHVKLEIPEFLDEARRRHPEIEIVYGRNIGLHERLLDLLVERFAEVQDACGQEGNTPSAVEQAAPNDTALNDTAIVLMGRGSSDPDANGDVYKIARILWERTGVSTVETCFTGITDPRLPEGVFRAVRLGAKRIFVIPYFLFTGVLIKRMKNLVKELQQQFSQVSIQMSPYFGLHDLLREVVLDRIKEADQEQSRMNCDFCQYRKKFQQQQNHSVSDDRHKHGEHAHRIPHLDAGEVLA